MPKIVDHTDVGAVLTEAEYHADTAHEFPSGTSFPGAPSEMDLFYRTDLHILFQYNGTNWIGIPYCASGSETITAGNTSVNVSHGLDHTPNINHIRINRQSDLKGRDWWLSDVGGSTFTININSASLSDDFVFGWQIVGG